MLLLLDYMKLNLKTQKDIAWFIKNFISYNRKPTESIFIEIFLPKSKPVLTGTLYKPPDKDDFVNCLEHTFSNTNVFESQECYLLSDININLQPNDKEIFRHWSANTINKEIHHLTRSHLEFFFTHFLEQIITRPTKITNQTVILIDHGLMNLPDNFNQSGVIDLGLSDHDLIYCTRNTSYQNPMNIMRLLFAQWKVIPPKGFWKFYERSFS